MFESFLICQKVQIIPVFPILTVERIQGEKQHGHLMVSIYYHSHVSCLEASHMWVGLQEIHLVSQERLSSKACCWYKYMESIIHKNSKEKLKEEKWEIHVLCPTYVHA